MLPRLILLGVVVTAVGACLALIPVSGHDVMVHKWNNIYLTKANSTFSIDLSRLTTGTRLLLRWESNYTIALQIIRTDTKVSIPVGMAVEGQQMHPTIFYGESPQAARVLYLPYDIREEGPYTIVFSILTPEQAPDIYRDVSILFQIIEVRVNTPQVTYTHTLSLAVTAIGLTVMVLGLVKWRRARQY